MEFCEKSLVNVLERIGVGYFEEKQVLTIFRDICNAVFAMHCQSPPVAHRRDGSWNLCDFKATFQQIISALKGPRKWALKKTTLENTRHRYRAPEALRCLLYQICYFKYAFDGESKLQILNGNYQISALPKYSAAILDLIRDMLQASPDDRPDITQARALFDWSFISMNIGMVSC
ncbi:hypothetical protein Syun_029988 [Stephania yunnanensis]|uniref:non-specific serine/threonine protein kinase n=1 Tax=Stephania yunnanensis TaxID=152371 RepID=A0AAP0EEY2_9MAGN